MTGRRAPVWILALWIGFVLACAVVLSRTQFTTDFSAFLPRSPSAVQQVLVDQLRDGIVSRLILVGLDGADPAVLARSSRHMAETLGADHRFAAVRNGQNVLSEKDRAYFWQNRYLLSPAVRPEHFSAAGHAGADAVLAASVFHFGTLTIGQVKDQMRRDGLQVR